MNYLYVEKTRTARRGISAGRVGQKPSEIAVTALLPHVEIEYCRQCRWLLRAGWVAQELLTTFDT